MENKVENNMQKYDNYREQFNRLKKALKNEFYLEAIFIEYAIIEDRMESLLRHSDKWEAYLKHIKGREPRLPTKITYFKKMAEEKKGLPHKYFSDTLLDDILAWKERRNGLIHALMNKKLTTQELSDFAHSGFQLTRELTNRARNYKRAVERRKAKTVENSN